LNDYNTLPSKGGLGRDVFMLKMRNKIIPYRSDLKLRARALRKNPTKAEALLWDRIRKKSLEVEFHRQVPVLDYILDFYCHEIGLAIELDGTSHRLKFWEDAKRQGRIESYGIHFLRFSNRHVLDDIEKVIARIQVFIDDALK